MLRALLKFSFSSIEEISANRPPYLGKLAEVASPLKKRIVQSMLVLACICLPLFILCVPLMPYLAVAKLEPYAIPLTTIALAYFMLAAIAVVKLESLTPLKRTDSGCEQALSLISGSPIARAYRDEILKKGDELLEVDLQALRYLAANSRELNARTSLRKEWSGADADEITESFRARAASIGRRSHAIAFVSFTCVSLILCGAANFSNYSVLQFLVVSAIIIGLGALVGVNISIGYESQVKPALEKAGPVWGAPGLNRSSLDTLKSIDELKKEGGAGIAYLTQLRTAGRSLTLGDLDKALELDKNAKREVFCKKIHDVVATDAM